MQMNTRDTKAPRRQEHGLSRSQNKSTFRLLFTVCTDETKGQAVVGSLTVSGLIIIQRSFSFWIITDPDEVLMCGQVLLLLTVPLIAVKC